MDRNFIKNLLDIGIFRYDLMHSKLSISHLIYQKINILWII